MLRPEPLGADDIEVPYLKSQHVQWEGVRLEDLPTMWASPNEVDALRLDIGDLLVCEGGDVGRAALIDVSPPENCIIQNALHRVRGRGKASVAFLRYLLIHATNQEWFDVLCNRSTIAHFTVEKFGEMWAWLPPLLQQQQLAALLDRETSRLDALMAAKQEQLELIAEKRRALITRAVTQGLNADAPRRATGLPWLGEVPAHWEVVRLKYLAQGPLDYGANEAADEDNPDFPRFIRITDIDEDGNLRSDTFASLAPELAEPYLLSDGDILLARSGATVGKTFIYRASMGPACFAGYLIRMHPQLRKVLADFIYNFSLTDSYWGQIRESAIQSTIQNFSAEKYGDMVLPLPDLHEQMLITAYIEAETKKLDTLRETTEISLGLIHEQRAALIAAAVTGKLDLINS
ncbi:restriction endonuclease subunit S [Hymenobacter saemangeumensis]